MMKSFFSFPVGLLVGAALTFGVVVQAEELKNYIGAQIEGQFPVMVDGVEIENPGIVVDETSYLPTRVIAELAGFEVKFDADLGIELVKNESLNESSQEVEQPVQTERSDSEVDPEYRLYWIGEEIKRLEMMKRPAMSQIKDAVSEESVARAQAILDDIESQIAVLEAEKAELEAQLAATPE